MRQEELTTRIEAISAFVIDCGEAVALADASRSIPRAPPRCDVMIDCLVFALACGSIFQILVSDWALGDDPNPPVNGYPWADSDDVALWYMVTIACVTILVNENLC